MNRTGSFLLSWLCLQVPKELTAQPAEPASIGGGHCHFDQVVPIIANLKPQVRVEENERATVSNAYPTLCRPYRQGHSVTIQLQKQGGHGKERHLEQQQEQE